MYVVEHVKVVEIGGVCTYKYRVEGMKPNRISLSMNTAEITTPSAEVTFPSH